MSLRVAVQMDPLESINIAGDSSFALMLSAQDRGHKLWHYDVRSLAWEDGRLTAWARPVRVQRVEGQHYGFEGDEAKIDLAADIDVVLMRQDPPFDLGYISAALLLDRLKGTTLVVNDPKSVINAPEKMFVLDYARFMEYSAVTHPCALPRRNGGTFSSTLAVTSTRVSPNDTSTDPSACLVKPVWISMARISSGARPDGRMVICSLGMLCWMRPSD